jgi:transcriptional regulator with XRE-family HTH domain
MKTSSALDIMKKRYGNSEERQERLAEERVRIQAARAIYEARKSVGLTQKQLADLVGTQQSVIARLEDSDYEGHTLSMLNRIAQALGQRVTVRFVHVGAGEEIEQDRAQAASVFAAACAPLLVDSLRGEIAAAVNEGIAREFGRWNFATNRSFAISNDVVQKLKWTAELSVANSNSYSLVS